MGNLVCVSCRACPEVKGSVTSGSLDRDEHNIVTATAAPTGDHATNASSVRPNDARSRPQPPQQPLNMRTADANEVKVCLTKPSPNGIPATWDSYLSPEVQACIKNEDSDDAQLSDVEKVAKGIVDVNLFVTSQVILPALERYRLEQQPHQQQLDQQPQQPMRQASVDDANEVDEQDEEEEDACGNRNGGHQVNRTPRRDKSQDDGMTIRVENNAGVLLVDKVVMF